MSNVNSFYQNIQMQSLRHFFMLAKKKEPKEGAALRHNLALCGARDVLFPLRPLQQGHFHFIPIVFAQEKIVLTQSQRIVKKKKKSSNIDIINFQNCSITGIQDGKSAVVSKHY